jgi:hypothetical protein
MGRKKYPSLCNCCQPPVVLKDSDSASYHKKTMSKRSATEEAQGPTPKKLSGLQLTVATFVEECEKGKLLEYFVNKPTAFHDILEYSLEKFSSQERLAIYDRLINLISAYNKKVTCRL